jgi:hypothetical protein
MATKSRGSQDKRKYRWSSKESPQSGSAKGRKLPMVSGRSQDLSSYLIRFVLFGALALLCALAVTDGAFFLAALLGIGTVFTGGRLLNRKGNRRRELMSRARKDMRELGRVAREDRIAAPQMKRLVGIQAGLLQSWELLPEAYRPLLDEDIFTMVGEIEGAARLGRRREALRRHLESVDRREISRRIENLEQDLVELEESSPLWEPHESALSGRRGDLFAAEETSMTMARVHKPLWSPILEGNIRGRAPP